MNIGGVEKLKLPSCNIHNESPMNRESIILSKQRSADSRWTRLTVRPSMPKAKAEEIANKGKVMMKVSGLCRGSLESKSSIFLN